MSNIDKRALREAAERAGQNDWEYVYTSDLSAPGRGYITVGGAEAIYCLNRATGGVKQSENVLRYIAAARPEKMLALLDEMEAAEKRIAELTEKPIGWTDEQELRDVEKLGCGYLFNANPITPHADQRRVILLYAATAGKGE